MIRIGKDRQGGAFFTHLILSFTLLAVILIGLVGGYLYVQANRLMIEEVARDSRERLSASSDFIENTLLQKYETSLRNRALSTMSLESQSMLNVLLDSDWEGNTSRIAAFRKELEIFKVGNEGVHNISVYFQSGDYVVDSSQFYMQTSNSPDSSYIRELKEAGLNRWIPRTLPDGEEVLTYAIALPYGSMPLQSEGAMYLDVKLSNLVQMASSMMSSPLEQLFVFNEEKNLFLRTNANNEKMLGFVRQRMEKKQEMYYDEREQFAVSYREDASSSNRWSYALVRPMNTFVSSSEQLKSQIIIGCLLVLLIGLLISYMISKRVYIPMGRLVTSIRGLYHHGGSPSPVWNEYAMIGGVLDKLGQKIERLESNAKVNELKNLLLGADLGLEYDHYLPRDCHYMICGIRMLEGSGEDFQYVYEQLAAYVKYKYVSLNAGEAAIIYFFEQQMDIDDAERLMQAEISRVKEASEGRLRFGAAFGTLAGSPEEIPFSYQCAEHAFRYRFFYGPEAVIRHSLVSAFSKAPRPFSFDAYKNALKAGNEAAMNRLIDDFQKDAGSGHLQLETVELGLLQFAATLYQVVIELDLQQLVPPSNLFDELKKETLAATIASIRSLSAKITSHVQESGNHAHAKIILKLKHFIDEHIHEDLSLNKLSEVASLAPSYISTLFGAVMNESFTEYVTRVRLERAATLLREERRRSVTEIRSISTISSKRASA